LVRLTMMPFTKAGPDAADVLLFCFCASHKSAQHAVSQCTTLQRPYRTTRRVICG